MKKYKVLHYKMLAYTFFMIAVGANIPASLYGIYSDYWGLTAGLVTLIFSIYAVILIPSLIIYGQLSDIIGRKKILFAGLLLTAAGSMLFLFARGFIWLFLARIIQGIAAGMLNGVATATFVELHPKFDRKAASLTATVCMSIGIGTGPLLAGIIAENTSSPVMFPYILHLVLLIPSFIALILMPETVVVKSLKGWSPQLRRVPDQIKKEFHLGGMALFLCWAAMALFMSVVPAFISTLLNIDSLVIAGGITFLVFTVSCCTQMVCRGLKPKKIMRSGIILLGIGMTVFLIAASHQSIIILFIGTILNGVGHGQTFMGSMAHVNQLSPPKERGNVISILYIWSYFGLGIPVLGLGIMSDFVGFLPSLTAFSFINILASVVLSFFIKSQLNKKEFHAKE